MKDRPRGVPKYDRALPMCLERRVRCLHEHDPSRSRSLIDANSARRVVFICARKGSVHDDTCDLAIAWLRRVAFNPLSLYRGVYKSAS